MSRNIGIASLIWGVSILLSRIVGILREAVIGRTIGSEGDADVYWASFVLPDFLNYLLAGGALSLVFIPIFTRYLANDDEEGGWRAFGVISSFLVLAMSAVVALGWIYAPTRWPLFGSLADWTYRAWASRRLQVTGRESLEVLCANRCQPVGADQAG